MRNLDLGRRLDGGVGAGRPWCGGVVLSFSWRFRGALVVFFFVSLFKIEVIYRP